MDARPRKKGLTISPRPLKPYIAVLLAAAMLAHTACSRVKDEKQRGEPESVPSASESAAAAVSSGADEETWAAVFIRGTKAGYQRVLRREIERNGQLLIRVETQLLLSVVRGGRRIDQDMKLVSLETPDGELVEFTTVRDQSGLPQVTTGRVDGERLMIETAGGGESSRHVIPWTAGDGGLAAVEESLRREPLEPGQRRTIRHFSPVVNQVATVRLAAQQCETVRLLGEDAQLLRVHVSTELPGGQQIDMVSWIDEQGEIFKTRLPALGHELIRTTRQIAMSDLGEANFDLLFDTMVRLRQPPDDPHAAQKIRYRVRVRDGNPAEVFPAGISQQVFAEDGDTAEVTVLAVRPDWPPSEQVTADVSPTIEDSEANAFIQSDDPRVRRLAAEAVGERSDTWSRAVVLERFVHDYMTETGYTQAFSTAAEAAASRSGDCTEHAVLLAALARAQEIPARVAIGLVYARTARGEGFAYHMWNEIYVRDRWIPMDGTLGRGGTGGGHLKLTDSNLSGADALAAFLPVVQVMGRLEIEVLGVQ